MAVTLDEFVQRLTDSGLMSPEEVAAALRQSSTNNQSDDVRSLVKQLTHRNRLTDYQSRALLAEEESAPLVLGDYVILERIGQGGMGVVFKARHRRMKRNVALKILSPEVTKEQDAINRFEREVEAVARVSHPNVVAAYDAGVDDGTHFLITEYVEGSDLSKLVKRTGPLSVDQAVDCVIQAARGLGCAHQRGIIHRDVKPSNLLLDGEGTVKVLDMGLARFETTNRGLRGLNKGCADEN